MGGRGQANLLAVAVALVLVTSVLGASIAIAESALVGATETRDAADRRAATTLAARLVSEAPPTYPAGVVPNRSTLTAERVDELAPMVRGGAVVVQLDDRTLLRRGDADGGVTVRRGVLVGTATNRTLAVDLATDETATLPHRTTAVTLDVRPGPNTTVHTVRVNDRIVLHNDSGLSGEATVPTSTRRTTELTFEAAATPVNATVPGVPAGTNGTVELSYTTVTGEPATLVVTVDV
jgi:hypothetical protein